MAGQRAVNASSSDYVGSSPTSRTERKTIMVRRLKRMKPGLRYLGLVAQLVEQAAFNRTIVSSNLTRPTTGS